MDSGSAAGKASVVAFWGRKPSPDPAASAGLFSDKA